MEPEHQTDDGGHGSSVSNQTLGSQQPVKDMDLIWNPTVLEHLSDDDLQLYLEFSRSGCIRGGGCSIEVALEVLYLSGGNIMLAIKKLLSLNKDAATVWTFNEILIFEGLLRHEKCGKDFLKISQQLGSKKPKECIEFYYVRCKRQNSSNNHHQHQEPHLTQLQHQLNLNDPDHENNLGLAPLPPDQFPCRVCGRVFLKIKSRSAHMKRHKNER